MAEEIVTRDEIRAMRRSYSDAGLETLPDNPFEAFAVWLKDAHENSVIVEANAMVLSTVTADSQINTRTVLLKDISDGGFTFFTNYQSRKAHGIELNPNVSLLFLGMQWSDKFQLAELLKKFQSKSPTITLQLDHGVHRLVHGQVHNLHTLHLAKSWNSDLKVQH